MSKHQIDALLPGTRQAVLGRLLFDPNRRWYLSELAESIGLTAPDIRRELSQLAEADIIKQWRDGNRVYFAANTDCPFFPELRGLLLKTTGLVDVIRDALEPLAKEISIAFVYGSVSKNKELSASDVDLMIVGDVNQMKLSQRLREAENIIQREINTSTYSKDEFHSKVQEKNHFLTSVLEEEKIFVLGSKNDLEALTKFKTD